MSGQYLLLYHTSVFADYIQNKTMIQYDRLKKKKSLFLFRGRERMDCIQKNIKSNQKSSNRLHNIYIKKLFISVGIVVYIYNNVYNYIDG